jgi:predicted Zn-dependent protease with MMP-like domain
MRLAAQDFDRLVEECMDIVPPQFRGRLRNLVFVVEAEPRGEELLGLFEGRPVTEQSIGASFEPPARITLYQGPHERAARTMPALRRLVRETIWHEVAHYFGLDERQVLEAEHRRQRVLHALRSRRRRRDL